MTPEAVSLKVRVAAYLIVQEAPHLREQPFIVMHIEALLHGYVQVHKLGVHRHHPVQLPMRN